MTTQEKIRRHATISAHMHLTKEMHFERDAIAEELLTDGIIEDVDRIAVLNVIVGFEFTQPNREANTKIYNEAYRQQLRSLR